MAGLGGHSTCTPFKWVRMHLNAVPSRDLTSLKFRWRGKRRDMTKDQPEMISQKEASQPCKSVL